MTKLRKGSDLPSYARVRSMLARAGVSRAVFYSLCNQLWMSALVPLTAFVIAHRLTPEIQGLYYTFASVTTLQLLVELGMATVITQVASHEWAHLSISQFDTLQHLSGTEFGKLGPLLRFARRWYSTGAFIIALGLGGGGAMFFQLTNTAGQWLAPWLLLCACSGLTLLPTPYMAILDGCNEITRMTMLRLGQNVAGSLALIGSLLAGAGLYAPAIALLVRFLAAQFVLIWRFGSFLKTLGSTPGTTMDWTKEIWPFQWRIALSWMAGAAASAAIVPISFAVLGAVAAGQFGMTLTFAAAMETACLAWINTRIPQFGMLIARRQYSELDAIFNRISGTVWLLSFVACGVLVLLHLAATCYAPTFGVRLLPLLPILLLLAQRILNIQVSGMAAYLRAHKREPLTFLSVLAAILTIAAVALGAKLYGVFGMAAGWLLVSALWTYPVTILIFRRCKTDWHGHQPDVCAAG